jgi:hypothetical protein
MNPITIRQSTHADARELRRLAELDSARPIDGPALIAEHSGHPGRRRRPERSPLDRRPVPADGDRGRDAPEASLLRL